MQLGFCMKILSTWKIHVHVNAVTARVNRVLTKLKFSYFFPIQFRFCTFQHQKRRKGIVCAQVELHTNSKRSLSRDVLLKIDNRSITVGQSPCRYPIIISLSRYHSPAVPRHFRIRPWSRKSNYSSGMAWPVFSAEQICALPRHSMLVTCMELH